MTVSKRRRLTVAIVIILLLIIAAVLFATLRPEAAARIGLRLPGVASESDTQTESDEGGLGAALKRLVSGDAAGDAKTGGTGGEPGGSGSSSGGDTEPGSAGGAIATPGTNGSADGVTTPDGQNPSADAETKVIKILWWNDTLQKKPTGFEIVFGGSTVKPDITKANGTGVIGPCEVGKVSTLSVYPDGRDGKRVDVEFTITAEMEPNSEIDAIHVEVSDTKVRVLGNPVKNFDVSLPRF